MEVWYNSYTTTGLLDFLQLIQEEKISKGNEI